MAEQHKDTPQTGSDSQHASPPHEGKYAAEKATERTDDNKKDGNHKKEEHHHAEKGHKEEHHQMEKGEEKIHEAKRSGMHEKEEYPTGTMSYITPQRPVMAAGYVAGATKEAGHQLKDNIGAVGTAGAQMVQVRAGEVLDTAGDVAEGLWEMVEGAGREMVQLARSTLFGRMVSIMGVGMVSLPVGGLLAWVGGTMGTMLWGGLLLESVLIGAGMIIFLPIIMVVGCLYFSLIGSIALATYGYRRFWAQEGSLGEGDEEGRRMFEEGEREMRGSASRTASRGKGAMEGGKKSISKASKTAREGAEQTAHEAKEGSKGIMHHVVEGGQEMAHEAKREVKGTVKDMGEAFHQGVGRGKEDVKHIASRLVEVTEGGPSYAKQTSA